MWIKTKVYDETIRLANTNRLDEIILSTVDFAIYGAINKSLEFAIYKPKSPTQEDSEKKMAKIERCFRDGRGYCDLDGEA
jgi:hypothetical protein